MICVYPADCEDFSNNGLGIVLPQSCSVTETLNGEWELTLIHPIDVDGKWTRLTEGCILRAPVPAAMTPQVGLVTQQYQTTVYDTSSSSRTISYSFCLLVSLSRSMVFSSFDLCLYIIFDILTPFSFWFCN